jgi:signal transduction histidine kinase/streptogramin lyase
MVLGLLLAVGALQSLPGPPTRWTVADGLPQGTINDVLQTPEGELWIATFGGLLRFDGLRFGVLDMGTMPELPGNRFTGLASDGGAGLWACTQDAQLVHLVEGRVLEVRAPPGDVEALDLLRGADGVLWVAMSGGTLFRVGERWTPLEGPGRPAFATLARTPAGGVLVGGERGLTHFAADGTQVAAWSHPRAVAALAAAPDGRVLVAAAGGAWLLEQGELRPLDVVPALASAIKTLWWDGGPRAFLGLQGALLAADFVGDELRHVPCEPAPPAGRDVRVLVRDVEDNLWLGSAGEGLERRRLSPAGGATERVGQLGVTGIVEDGRGGLWMALECNGLRRYAADGGDLGRWPMRLPESGSEPCVQALALDGAGRLWLVAGQVVAVQGPDGFDPPSAAVMLESKALALLADGADGMWAATDRGSLCRLDGQAELLERIELGARAVSLARAPDGAVWIGGDGRLWRHGADGTRAWGAEAGLPRGDVRSILVDPDGSLWLALYGGGLVRFEDGRARQWTTAQGLPDNAGSGLVDDGRGSLWLLCNRGVAVIERADLQAVARGERARLTPLLLGEESGISEGNAGFPVACRTGAGDLWFGTLQGAARVRAADFPHRARAPLARIERVSADDVELPREGALAVPALTQRVSIEYTAFALSVPERVRFRVQLEPFDESWRDHGGERSISYTSLPPGEYVFRVSARNEHGVWSARAAELALVVLPAWWQRASVQTLGALAVLAALAAAYRARVGLLQRRAQVLLDAIEARNRAEQGQSRLRDELAHLSRVATTEGLAASLAHEVNQPLAAITTNAAAGRRLLERGGAVDAELREILADIAAEGTRASEVVRRLRDFLGKRASERLPFQPDALVRDTLPLMQRELDDHRVRLEVALDGRGAHVLGDRVQVQQVLVNLLQNACEAFRPQQTARHVRVSSLLRGRRFVIAVADDGPGLAPEVARDLFRSFVTTKPKGMGLGLSISSTIAEAHGGRLRVESAPGGGARFELDLPLVEEPPPRAP